MLLLCACATQRQAEKYFDRNTDELAAYVDKNEAYTKQHGRAYAAKHFPPKFYPPAVYPQKLTLPDRQATVGIPPDQEKAVAAVHGPVYCPKCRPTVVTKTRYLTRTEYITDTVRVDSLHRELEIESLANQALRKRLKTTETQRDYWQEQNRKKFWTLIAMAVFGFLYILFKVLAARVRENE